MKLLPSTCAILKKNLYLKVGALSCKGKNKYGGCVKNYVHKMRKLAFLFLALSFLAASAQALTFTPKNITWVIETVPNAVTNDFTYDTSIAVDSNNRPHIVYNSGAVGSKSLKYVYKSPAGWITPQTVDSQGHGEYSSIAVDSDNNIHISYGRVSSGCGTVCVYLKYASKSPGGVWNIRHVDQNNGVGQMPDIAVDSNGNIHIVHFKSDETLRYSFKSASTPWSAPWYNRVADSIIGTGYLPSIYIDSNNNIHVSYGSSPTAGEDLRYAFKSSSTPLSASWAKEIVDLGAAGNWLSSIVVDSNKKIHITYGSGLRYAFKSLGGDWNKQVINMGFGKSSSAIDLKNNMHVATSSAGLMYAFKSSSGDWNWQTADSVGGGNNSIAIDSNGNIHISHWVFSGGPGYIKYAFGIPENFPPIADFNYFPLAPLAGQLVDFNDLSFDSDGVIVDWNWNFFRSGILDVNSYDQNVSRTFSAGDYNVMLTVADNRGSKATVQKTVTVTEPCGNGIIDAGEVCDGGALAGNTCVSKGFDSGVLACKADCSDFDVSACVSEEKTALLELTAANIFVGEKTIVSAQCSQPAALNLSFQDANNIEVQGLEGSAMNCNSSQSFEPFLKPGIYSVTATVQGNCTVCIKKAFFTVNAKVKETSIPETSLLLVLLTGFALMLLAERKKSFQPGS